MSRINCNSRLESTLTHSHKACVTVSSITNIPVLAGKQTIDGYTLQTGDSVLLLGQTNPAKNGVYFVSNKNNYRWEWRRDWEHKDGHELGCVIIVLKGTARMGNIYAVDSLENFNCGTHIRVFTLINAGGAGGTADGVVTSTTFDSNTNIVTLTRSNGLSNLTFNLSSLAGTDTYVTDLTLTDEGSGGSTVHAPIIVANSAEGVTMITLAGDYSAELVGVTTATVIGGGFEGVDAILTITSFIPGEGVTTVIANGDLLLFEGVTLDWVTAGSTVKTLTLIQNNGQPNITVDMSSLAGGTSVESMEVVGTNLVLTMSDSSTVSTSLSAFLDDTDTNNYVTSGILDGNILKLTRVGVAGTVDIDLSALAGGGSGSDYYVTSGELVTAEGTTLLKLTRDGVAGTVDIDVTSLATDNDHYVTSAELVTAEGITLLKLTRTGIAGTVDVDVTSLLDNNYVTSGELVVAEGITLLKLTRAGVVGTVDIDVTSLTTDHYVTSGVVIGNVLKLTRAGVAGTVDITLPSGQSFQTVNLSLSSAYNINTEVLTYVATQPNVVLSIDTWDNLTTYSIDAVVGPTQNNINNDSLAYGAYKSLINGNTQPLTNTGAWEFVGTININKIEVDKAYYTGGTKYFVSGDPFTSGVLAGLYSLNIKFKHSAGTDNTIISNNLIKLKSASDLTIKSSYGSIVGPLTRTMSDFIEIMHGSIDDSGPSYAGSFEISHYITSLAESDIYVISGEVVGTDIILTNNDASTVTIDASTLAGGTDIYVESGEVIGTDIVLTNNDASTVTIDASTIASGIETILIGEIDFNDLQDVDSKIHTISIANAKPANSMIIDAFVEVTEEFINNRSSQVLFGFKPNNTFVPSTQVGKYQRLTTYQTYVGSTAGNINQGSGNLFTEFTINTPSNSVASNNIRIDETCSVNIAIASDSLLLNDDQTGSNFTSGHALFYLMVRYV